MSGATALTHVVQAAQAQAHRPWGWRGTECVTRGDFAGQVQQWQAAFAETAGQQVALYFDDTLHFAAALFGAWHAGKHVVLPGDAQAVTLQHLQAQVDVWAGNLPGAVQALPTAAPAVLQPLSMSQTRLSMFTSGSSGQPTRIDKTLAQLDAEVQSLHALFGAVGQSAPWHVLATVSHQHIYGLLFRVLWPLASTRTTDAHMLRYPEELLQHMAQHAESVLVSSPALLGRLPAHLDWSSARDGLRGVFSSGGPLSAAASQLALELLEHSPVEVFGSSETGGIAWRQRAAHGERWNLLPQVLCRIDSEGLLEVQSPHLVDPQQWWTTSDRAQLLEDGSGFSLQGRVDRIVKIAEKRVSLTAMEQALHTHPWVQAARAVVLPVSSVSAAERIGMVLELTALGWEQLQAQGRRDVGLALQAVLLPHVERVALPRHWRYVEQLPMNAQGKSTQQQLAVLFRPVWPPLLWQTRTELKAQAVWEIAPDLLVFDGHFPQAPLVPGVAQVAWVEWTARQAFAMPRHFVRAEVLKFQIPIVPNARVDVDLQWLPEKSALQFALTSALGTHASGRLVWGE